jgi:hypothetical protein
MCEPNEPLGRTLVEPSTGLPSALSLSRGDLYARQVSVDNGFAAAVFASRILSQASALVLKGEFKPDGSLTHPQRILPADAVALLARAHAAAAAAHAAATPAVTMPAPAVASTSTLRCAAPLKPLHLPCGGLLILRVALMRYPHEGCRYE